MRIVSLFFCFSLTLLAHTEGQASQATTLSALPGELFSGTNRTSGSFLLASTVAKNGDFDGSLTDDDKAKTMQGTVSTYGLLVQASPEEKEGYSGVSVVFSPLAKKDSIVATDDEPVHRRLLGRSFKEFPIVMAENGIEAIDKATDFARKGIPVKLFLFDFRMGAPDGGETALQVRDIEHDGQKSFQNSIFICVSSTPDDAISCTIKDLSRWFVPGSKSQKEVFHRVRGKVDSPAKAREVVTFVNELLDALASYQLGVSGK
ncbi:MAG: hypothetical protein K2W94_00340 [Alphaproteobacteria bacterium]|nr:hypothetical protein [Alphaproteobacteria bacterium]